MSKALLTLLSLLVLVTSAQSQGLITDLTDDLNSSNGTCNLREAITAANTGAPSDACESASQYFFADSGTVTLLSPLPTIEVGLELLGPGVDLLTIDANGVGRVFDFFFPSSVTNSTLIGMTITNGLAGSGSGGGIHFDGESSVLTLKDITISDNTAASGGGVSFFGKALSMTRVSLENNTAASSHGGGLAAEADGDFSLVHIEGSTISGNIASGGTGGGAWILGDTISIIQSTISGNSSRNYPGVYMAAVTSSAMSDCTVTENDVIPVSGLPGGVYSGGVSTQIRNNLIMNNDDGFFRERDLGGLFTSLGNNLIGDNGGIVVQFPVGFPNANGDYVGDGIIFTLANQVSSLADNGGPTKTHLPIAGLSDLVVDTGACPLAMHDQRGATGGLVMDRRPVDGSVTVSGGDECDIGAVEFVPAGAVAQSLLPKVDLKVFLDGPYNSNSMLTGLANQSLLPNTQPYDLAPWAYDGTETLDAIPADMVDWVLMEFGEGSVEAGVTKVLSMAVPIDANGEDINVEADPEIAFMNPGYYWVKVQHRNHLSVTKLLPVYWEWSSPSLSLDFTAVEEFTAGGAPQRNRGGVFTMWAGDGDSSSDVTAFDFLNIWLPANGGPAAYQNSDFNLDGITSAFDFLNAWLPSNGQASQSL